MEARVALALALVAAAPARAADDRPTVFFTEKRTQLIIPGEHPQVVDLPPVYIVPPETMAVLNAPRPVGGASVGTVLLVAAIGIVAGGVAAYFLLPPR